jgi:Transposase, Mutator family
MFVPLIPSFAMLQGKSSLFLSTLTRDAFCESFHPTIYTAATESEAEQALILFAERWDKQYPMISKSWINHWQRIIPFFAFPLDIRKAIYTTKGRDTLEEALILRDEVLIGQTILEKLDLLVDCANQRLLPNPAHPDQPVSKVK